MAKSKTTLRAVPDAPRAIALELAPLIQPFRKHGKVSIRVERIPRFARLSRGRNNGDGSWSLATDELEDLEYLPPEGNDAAHTLVIRIVNLDHGETLSVIDYPIPVSNGKAPSDQRGDAGTGRARDPETPSRRPREDWDALTATLADRDAELSEMRRSLEQSEADLPNKIASAVALAHESLKSELEQNLASIAARSSREFEEDRSAWLSEKNALLAETKAHAETRVEEVRDRARREVEDAKAKAEVALKSAEAARFAKAEAEWRAKSERIAQDLTARCERAEAALADAHARADALRTPDRSELEHRMLVEEVATMRIALEKRDAELSEARSAAEKVRENVSKTEASWRVKSEKIASELAARCQRAETQLAEARAQIESLKKPKLSELEHRRALEEAASFRAALAKRDAELDGIRKTIHHVEDGAVKKIASEVAAARASWKSELEQELAAAAERYSEELEANRNAWLAEHSAQLTQATERAEKHIAEARERWRRAAEETLLQAEKTWKTAEAARFGKAEAQWREKSAIELGEAKARFERAESALAEMRAAAKSDRGAAERARLAEELANVRAELGDRTKELARARTATEEATERLRNETQTAISKARTEWIDEEKSRFASFEAKWRKQSDEAIASATARFEEAEGQLAELRSEVQAQRGLDSDGVISRLRDKISVLQATLIERERELGNARKANAAESRSAPPQPKSNKIVLRQNRDFEEAPPPPVEQREEPRRTNRIPRDIVLVGIFAAVLVMLWPTLEPYLPDSWKVSLGLATYAPEPPPPPAAAPKPVVLPPAPPPSPTATLFHSGSVHSDTDKSANVVAKLERGAKVLILGQRGNWVHIRFDGTDGKPQEGWIYNSLLKDSAAAASPAPVTLHRTRQRAAALRSPTAPEDASPAATTPAESSPTTADQTPPQPTSQAATTPQAAAQVETSPGTAPDDGPH